MRNHDVADVLREIAGLLEVEGVEYKPRAYRRAARNVEALSEPVEDVAERGELESIEGVGDSIAATITTYLDTGEPAELEELRAAHPLDVEALTSVEGVGPRTAERLYEALGVATLDDLERAAEEGQIAELEGFGERSQANVREAVARAKANRGRTLLGRAVPVARAIETRLAESDAFGRVDVVGSFRRRRPTVGDVDVLATADDPTAAATAFCEHDDVREVLARGETRSSVVVSGGLQVDLRIVDESEYGAALVYFTGSKAHNISLRTRAINRGWKLNEYGLFDVREVGEEGQRVGERIASETEAAVYEALDLAWIAPELREDTGEIEAAADDDLPELVEYGSLRGDLQVHTDASDGAHTVREMAEAADERGLEYVLLTDHGPNAPVPSRLDEAAFERQREAVAAVRDDEAVDVTVLQGVEAEIGADGVDLPDGWVEACDLVVGALHGRPDDATERLAAAVEGPVDVLAHPTNRLLGERAEIPLDLDRVMAAAGAAGVAVEVNARPERLDLGWASVKEYRGTVSYVVSSDAHAAGEFDDLDLGVAQARRGWCEAADVLNTRSLDDLRAFFE
ncbi:MAG: helix-hairpin-helix domain-containing protein [Haloferacaceae archaeon]